MIKHAEVEIDEQDREQAFEGLMSLRTGADIMLELSAKNGVTSAGKQADMVIPFDLDNGITVVVIKRHEGGATH